VTSGSAGHGPVKHGHFMGKTMGKQWENHGKRMISWEFLEKSWRLHVGLGWKCHMGGFPVIFLGFHEI
jgi:hypothetical protein